MNLCKKVMGKCRWYRGIKNWKSREIISLGFRFLGISFQSQFIFLEFFFTVSLLYALGNVEFKPTKNLFQCWNGKWIKCSHFGSRWHKLLFQGRPRGLPWPGGQNHPKWDEREEIESRGKPIKETDFLIHSIIKNCLFFSFFTWCRNCIYQI